MDTSVTIYESVSYRWSYVIRPAFLSMVLPTQTIGAYVLMHEGAPVYVGRSDHCLLTRLSGHPLRSRATHVTFEPRQTCEAAFHLESAWFHMLNPDGTLLNKVHPARPANALIDCPFCTPGDNDALNLALRPSNHRRAYAKVTATNKTSASTQEI